MKEAFAKAYRAALGMMESSGEPSDLHEAARFTGRNHGVKVGDEPLRDHLRHSVPDDTLRTDLHLNLAKWDSIDQAEWTQGTAPNSLDRRFLVLQKLRVDDPTVKLFNDQFPVAGGGDIVIADEDDWQPWYTDEVRQKRDFYWKSYRRLLADKGWPPSAITALDRTTNEVVERLTDPTRIEAFRTKGLVVGYVQSGKTANFTGVVAKAIDAGYRLVIILTGITDMLRSQTQRRLDMELIGVENILGGVDETDADGLADVDYQDDADWHAGKFLKHGVRPWQVGRPVIHRLTTFSGDYKSLKAGIEALNFPKRERGLPFYDPANLYASDAKVAIVKKNASVLGKLVKDLKKITAKLGEIPVLIIDDESDQASVNTSNPKKWVRDQKGRTAINRLISQLLRDLPRAQYVGYTATPFANVFIDPSDAEDIFPKQFLISLDPPPAYMGAADFHDLDGTAEGEDVEANSNKRAHVRIVNDTDDTGDTELLRAIDTFVLTGAVKLYREAMGSGPFRHHTMLVHENMKRDVHREQADRIRDIWNRAGYYSTASRARLMDLYANDILRVSQYRSAGEGNPNSFEDLMPYISEAVARIGGGKSPVLIVNSDRIEGDDEQLDFDRSDHVWRILVGGNKLARGFTVEGLTVSYFLRKSRMADTMMQMGRWCGYRKGYRDLVRLYLTDDLYEAFEATVRDEEYFRSQLRLYAETVNGKPQVTPEQIPPLVSQHLPGLKPTASNKMYNVELVERRSPGKPVEPTGYPRGKPARRHNRDQFKPLLDAAKHRSDFRSSRHTTYPVSIGTVPHSTMLDVLRGLIWEPAEYFKPDLEWLLRMGPEKISDWAIMLPQHSRRDARRAEGTVLGHGPLSLFERRRRADRDTFGAISDPKHRNAAALIVGTQPTFDDPEAERWAHPRRGAMTVYPAVNPDGTGDPAERELIMAFRLLAPKEATAEDGRLVRFRTIDQRRGSEAIIDRPPQ